MAYQHMLCARLLTLLLRVTGTAFGRSGGILLVARAESRLVEFKVAMDRIIAKLFRGEEEIQALLLHGDTSST